MENKLVQGLTYIPNFITTQQQKYLIQEIYKGEWNTSLKRRTQHYGYQYSYQDKNSIKKTTEIPIWVLQIKKAIEEEITDKILGQSIEFDQIIINEYEPGQGISPHIDNPHLFGPIVVSLSLASSTFMWFESIKQKKQELVQIKLQRKSLIILTGPVRYQWKHSIPARKKDNGVSRSTRLSLTFRSVKQYKIE